MELSPYWEPSSYIATQKFPQILWNPNCLTFQNNFFFGEELLVPLSIPKLKDRTLATDTPVLTRNPLNVDQILYATIYLILCVSNTSLYSCRCDWLHLLLVRAASVGMSHRGVTTLLQLVLLSGVSSLIGSSGALYEHSYFQDISERQVVHFTLHFL
jgi:hypothetical protein